MRLPASMLLRLVLSLGIFVAGFAPRVVLCLGSDGHRAIESLDAPCCRGATSSTGMDGRCARSCTDLPLCLGIGVRDSGHGGPTIDRPATPVPSDSATSLPARVCTRLGGGAAPPFRLAHHPRSIILLC